MGPRVARSLVETDALIAPPTSERNFNPNVAAVLLITGIPAKPCLAISISLLEAAA